MARDMSSFVERYQLLYEKDPQSKVFAPLAEAYRRMGLLDEAIDLAQTGVKLHPHFASGRVALGKCYVQKGRYAEAADQLKIAAELSPENLLAHQLLAECYSQLKRGDLALGAYKIVLYLNPNDARTAEIVRKLEAQLYAGTSASDEIKEDYAMGRVHEMSETREEKTAITEPEKTPQPSALTAQKANELEQELALLDARFDRGDWAAVREQLGTLLALHPENAEVIERKSYLDEITHNNLALTEWLVPIAPDLRAAKVEKLKGLLARVEARRKA